MKLVVQIALICTFVACLDAKRVPVAHFKEVQALEVWDNSVEGLILTFIVELNLKTASFDSSCSQNPIN